MRFFKSRYLKAYRTALSILWLTVCVAAFIPGLNTLTPVHKIHPLTIVIRFAASFSILTGLWIFIHAGISLLFGRVYCAAFCPLGTLQNLLDTFFKKIKRFFFTRKRPNKKHNSGEDYNISDAVSFSVLFLTSLLFAFDAMLLLIFLDPYSLFARTTLSLKSPVFTAGIIQTILLFVLIFFYNRFFCKALCPSGTFLKWFSRKPFFSIKIDHTCTTCGKCETVCETNCINSREKIIDEKNCIRCFKCLSVCPTESLSFQRRNHISIMPVKPKKTFEIKQEKEQKKSEKNTKSKFLLSRRENQKNFFYTILFILSVGLWGKKRLAGTKLKKKTDDTSTHLTQPLPPGAGSIERFYSLCSGCGLCEATCPSSVITIHKKKNGPLPSLFRPSLNFKKSFCEYECRVCTTTCPTGALTPLSLEEKKITAVGKAVLTKQKCIPYTRGLACGACAEHCPTGALTMKPLKHITAPVIDPSLCTGCGACQYICPVKGKAIVVRPLSKHTKSRPIEDSTPAENPLKNGEFPF